MRAKTLRSLYVETAETGYSIERHSQSRMRGLPSLLEDNPFLCSTPQKCTPRPCEPFEKSGDKLIHV